MPEAPVPLALATRLELFRRLSYYNLRRWHTALGYFIPAEFEQQLITSRTLPLVG
ncbi:hypothetical protein HTV45_04130 [Streptomyces sp. CHD11]|nr:hypothetical protein [Streptomyces sp. CHD11]